MVSSVNLSCLPPELKQAQLYDYIDKMSSPLRHMGALS